MDEVYEYLPALERKKRLQLDTLLLALATLPVTVVDRAEYRRQIAEAGRRMRQRDPNDVDVLALALHLKQPVWSNDNDFEVGGIKWHTTAELLKALNVHSE